MSGDITAANRLYIANDASLNGNVFVKKNINVRGNATIKTYSASATTYQVGYTFVEMSDVSLSGRLFAMNDVSLNGRLFMGSDASFGNRLFITGDLSAGGNIIGKTITAPIMNIATDINMTSFSVPYVQQFGIVSSTITPTPPIPKTNFVNLSNYAQYSGVNSILLNTLYSNSDASFGSRILITADASLNSRLFIGSDTSLNSRLYVGGDSSFGGRLFIPFDFSFNSRLFIGNDVSLNGRLFVKGDLSLNRNLYSSLFKSNTLNIWTPIPGLTTNANWTSTSCSSTGQYMVAAWSNNSVYLSSSYGVGGTWAPVSSLPGSNVAWASSCVSATGQYMFITSNGGGAYLSSGYGAANTWAQIPTSVLPTTANFINSIISSTGQYILTVDNNSGSVYLSVGYGASGSWGPIPSPVLPTNSAWGGVAMSLTGQYMAVSIIGSSLYLSSNYGVSWTAVSAVGAGSWQNISMSGSGQYIIAANNSAGSLYVSADFGNTWNVPVGIPTNSNWSDVTLSSNGQYVTACNNTTGYIYYSSNYGITWATVTNMVTSNSWLNVSMSSTGLYVLASISGGAVYMTSLINTLNMNATVGFNNSTPQYTLDVSGTMNSSQGLVTTGITPSTTLYQQNWAIIPSLPSNGSWTYSNGSISSNGQYIITGTNGNVYLSNNYGQSWSKLTGNILPTFTAVNGISMSSTGQYMVVQNSSSFFYISSNYGVNWAPITGTNLPTNGSWLGNCISSTGQYMLAGTYGGSVYLSSNFGLSWNALTSIATNGTWYGTSMSSTGQYMLAPYFTSFLYLSNNYGSTWTTLGASNGLPSIGSWTSSAISSNGQYMLTGLDSGTANATVFISNNYGQTWNPAPIYGTYCQCVAMSSTGQYMFIGTNNQGSYTAASFSSNYGITWSSIPALQLTGTTTNYTISVMSANAQYIFTANNAGAAYLSVGTLITTLGLNNPVPQYTLDIANNTNTQKLSTYSVAPTNFAGTYSYVADLAAAYTWTSSTVSGNGQYMLVTTAGAGGVWISTTYGTTWSQTTLPSTSAFSWNYGAISSTGQYMLAASTTGFFISTDYGSTWSMIRSLSSSVSYYGLSMSSTGQYMLATVNGTTGVYLSTSYGAESVPPYGGSSWILTTLSTSYSYLATGMSSDGKYMVASQYSPAGSLYISSNYGVTWTQVTSGAPTSAQWYQVGMSNSGQYIIAGVIAGYTYVSSNYGASFTQTTLAAASASTQQPCSISGTGQYMFVANNNGAFYSINFGVSWTQIAYLPASTVWRFGSMSSTGQFSLQIIQSGYVYLSQGTNVTSANQIANFGANSSWTNLSSVFSNSAITGCAMSGTGQYMILGTPASVGCYLSTNYGYSFTQIAPASVPTTGSYYASAISSTGQYMILANVNASTVIYRSVDYGATWATVTMPISEGWYSAAISSTGQFMIICSGNTRIYYSSNYGIANSWTLATGGVPPTLSSGNVYGCAISADGSYMLAAPTGGATPIYMSTNYGVTWAATTLLNATGVCQVGVSSTAQYMVAVTWSGFSYYSNNYGVSWIKTSLASAGTYQACAISSTGQYMFVATSNGGFFSNTYGTTWSIIPYIVGSNFRYAAMSSNGQYILSPQYGTAGLCYTSFGSYVNVPATYTPVITNSTINQAVSQYAPQQNPGTLNINSSSAITGTNYLSAWTSFTTVIPGSTWFTFMSPTGQYMISGHQNTYGVYWSTNYGASWSQYPTGTLPTAVWWVGSAFSYNSQYILVCGVNGVGAGVYLSTNFGQNFSLISNAILPTANQFYGCCMSSTGQYMLTSTNTTNGFYLSTNYGVAWTKITGTNLPTNAACYTPSMSSTGQYMLIAPTSGSVYVSTNYGVAWTAVPLASGLPTATVWMQGSISSTGQYMIVSSCGGATSTGYSYLSTNFGTTWTTISVPVATSPTANYYAVAVCGTGQYMMINYDKGAYFSNNFGASWYFSSALPAYNNYGFASMSYTGQYASTTTVLGGTVYVCSGINPGSNTSALTTATNYGANSTWSAITNISSSAVKEGTAISSSGQYMYAGGSGIGLWWSQNFGVTWAQNTNGVPTNGAIQQIGISSTGQYVLVSVSGSGMYLSTNYGQTFGAIGGTLTNTFAWYAAAVSGTGQYMICGANSTTQQGLYLSSNYGVAWTAVSNANVPTGNSPISMAMSSNGQYMLTGGWSVDSPLYLSSNFGANWASIPVSAGVITNARWFQMAISSTGQYMIAANNTGSGLTFISSNYGVTWWSPQVGQGVGDSNFNACAVSGTGKVMLVQNYAGSFVSTNYGASWTVIDALPRTSWRQPSISYTGQYILTQQFNNGCVWLSSGITGVGINNSTPQNALDIVGPMKYPTYMASGYLTNSLLTTYGTGLPYTNTPGYPSSLTSAGAYYAPVTGIYNLICNFSITAATAQTWRIYFYTWPAAGSLNITSPQSNTNILSVTAQESVNYTKYQGSLRYTGKILAGSYVWVIATNGSNVAVTSDSWGYNSTTSTNLVNNFTGYLVSAL